MLGTNAHKLSSFH